MKNREKYLGNLLTYAKIATGIVALSILADTAIDIIREENKFNSGFNNLSKVVTLDSTYSAQLDSMKKAHIIQYNVVRMQYDSVIKVHSSQLEELTRAYECQRNSMKTDYRSSQNKGE